MKTFFGRLLQDSRGSTIVEFTFVLPVLLTVVIGIMEIAWLGWAKATLDFATAEAARCGVVRPDICGTTAQIQSYGASEAAGLSVTPYSFTVTQASCGLMVTAQAGTGFISYVLPKNISLTSQVCRS